MYDMIIIGGGPAGLSASIYMARAKYKTLVLEKEKFGGQITITSEIVNYPGVYHTSGTELTKNMQKQAEAFGAEFKLCEVLEMDLDGDVKTIKTTTGEFQTLGVILAVGASPRKLGFIGESEYAGRGVAYCATCDGEFFTGKTVYVVGGGFAAVEEGIFLTKYASEVRMIVRGDDFSCAKTVSDHVYNEPKISVRFNSEVLEVAGESSLKSIKIHNSKTNEDTLETFDDGFGVFVFAGYEPNTKWLGDKIKTENGYIITDEKQQTNIDGVYGAGDVCIKDLRQVVTAVSDGALSATCAEKYVANLHTKLNIPAFDVVAKGIKPEEITEKKAVSTGNDDKFITDEIRNHLAPIFEKFENTIIVKAVLDNSELGTEMKGFMHEMQTLSDKIDCIILDASKDETAPYIELLYNDETSSGIKYYAMPGGHEFNSFILAMYNISGKGKEIDESDASRAKSLEKTDIKVLISLSCTMCPEVVVATQKIASLNENVTASAIDITHFTSFKDKYNVMSVPCMVINDEIVHFGKKNITQILDIIGE